EPKPATPRQPKKERTPASSPNGQATLSQTRPAPAAQAPPPVAGSVGSKGHASVGDRPDRQPSPPTASPVSPTPRGQSAPVGVAAPSSNGGNGPAAGHAPSPRTREVEKEQHRDRLLAQLQRLAQRPLDPDAAMLTLVDDKRPSQREAQPADAEGLARAACA